MVKIVIPKLESKKTRADLSKIVETINAEIKVIHDAIKETQNNG